jgi:hypothetical protein
MNKIPMPDISPNFTLEDIRKIRDYHAELFSDMTRAEQVAYYRKEGQKAMDYMKKLREARA